MTAAIRPFTAVVLAAQRAGTVNPLAARAGVSHKCLVPIQGLALITHVAEALAGCPGLIKVRISLEPEAHGEILRLLRPFADRGIAIECVASSSNIAESVIAAAQGQQPPFLITTADNVLLSREAVADTLAALESADAVANLAKREAVLAIHPQAQRRFYEFRDGAFANCNLYGVAGPHAFRATDVFRQGGQFMKNPGRLVRAFGLVNILLFRLRLVTLAGALRLVSRRFKLTFRALVLKDGSQAVDVDNERTFAIAEAVLGERGVPA